MTVRYFLNVIMIDASASNVNANHALFAVFMRQVDDLFWPIWNRYAVWTTVFWHIVYIVSIQFLTGKLVFLFRREKYPKYHYEI